MRWALVDFGHPFYRPLVRRIIIFVLVVVWTGVEFFAGSTGWMLFFLALSAYVGWGFFLSGQADGQADGKIEEPREADTGTARTPPPEGEN
ncbi:MAG: hypothetical protein H6887_02880 [Hoeflea sp.]|nr:hypothetical protein [Hoeflea sp.]